MKIKFLATDVVASSVYFEGDLADLPEPIAQACLDKGIAERVSMETQAEPESAPAVDITELIPTKTGKSKGA